MKFCPVCDSENVSTTYRTSTVSAPDGPEVSYNETVDTCVSCLEVGDFDAENDDKIELAYAESASSHCTQLLSTFEARGVSRVTICYALRLSPTTVFATITEAALLQMLLKHPEYLDEEWKKL